MGIEQFIDNEVKANDVVLFMKGTPQFPQCGFSALAVQALSACGVNSFFSVNVLENPDIRRSLFAALANVRPSHLFDTKLRAANGANEAVEGEEIVQRLLTLVR